ncbi:hypothetical protein HOG16_02470 [Candidatus Woesearchaeota archaeon]|jgi:protein-tyrosine-phosphatase|nr:hypothetical protein [Candidatus Woesearchaeota archaeon]MBT4321961.1 hypothetical protein [Candidatus Woesearchaeota archaeon]MBT4631313.1 hypothetical protein [Candidatus Woesearchaeota archaeon]
MNILFICKHNRFRSKVAEALFKELNKNKKVNASSAGLMQGDPISSRIIKITKRNNIKIKGKPKYLSDKLIREQDIIINVAENVPSRVFREYKKVKTISWKTRDVSEGLTLRGYNLQTTRLIERIRKKVEKLVKKLEKV